MKHDSELFTEALETLSAIATLNPEEQVAETKSPLAHRAVRWLQHKNGGERVTKVVKETLHTVLGYLKEFYKREFTHQKRLHDQEDIQNVMALVGEAAKNLDKVAKKFTNAHVEDIRTSKEFQQLTAFYNKKVAVVAGVKSQVLPEQHVYLDLESVKNDSEYELFHIRREDGTRFFSSSLIHSLGVVSTLDHTLTGRTSLQYALLDASENSMARQYARGCLLHAHALIDEFLESNKRRADHEGISVLYQAIEALLLAAHHTEEQEEQVFDEEAKTVKVHKKAHHYLLDFQKFLRRSFAFKGNQELKSALIESIFLGSHVTMESREVMHDLIAIGRRADHDVPGDIVERLEKLYTDLHAATKAFLQAPLRKSMATLDDYEIRGFDPYLMQNLPVELYEVRVPGHRTSVLKLPVPIIQSYIHKAEVAPEFIEFVKGLGKKKYLLFNLQDRTSWKEFARSNAVEQLSQQLPNMVTVTMTRDSDFYHQNGSYATLNQADLFIEQLLEHIESEASGYYYPEFLKKELFPYEARALAEKIHETFFHGKNVLSQAQRVNFIDMFYLFLEMKIIEIVRPEVMSFSCKSGVDVSLPAAAEFMIFLRYLEGKAISEGDKERIEAILFGLPLLVRGRTILREPFNRFVKVVQIFTKF